ncbi:MAG: hypothetical protein FWC95_06485 [Defluviitaleaceae bacterium]|nr:hypothetical protein [Defluviitaleaceae bacterium]
MIRIEISTKIEFNAIYFGLCLGKYEFACINKTDEIVGLQRSIEDYGEANLGAVKEFFRYARGITCDVYPFWPCAALLETALFYMDGGVFDSVAYRTYVCGLTNITDEERNDEFFAWVEDFPTHLQTVLDDEFFQEINYKLDKIVGSLDVDSDVRRLTDSLAVIPAAVDKLNVLICPLKCCYSADYFTYGREMSVLLGDYLPHSIIHEYMHIVVRPHIEANRVWVLENCCDEEYGIDSSYYMDGGENGFLNAYEEAVVRHAANEIANGKNVDIEELVKFGLVGGSRHG